MMSELESIDENGELSDRYKQSSSSPQGQDLFKSKELKEKAIEK